MEKLPALHCWQEVAPAVEAEKKPGAHSEHRVAPVAFEKDPTAHDWHDWSDPHVYDVVCPVPNAEIVMVHKQNAPMPHGHPVHEVEPATDVFPASHAIHADAPVICE